MVLPCGPDFKLFTSASLLDYDSELPSMGIEASLSGDMTTRQDNKHSLLSLCPTVSMLLHLDFDLIRLEGLGWARSMT